MAKQLFPRLGEMDGNNFSNQLYAVAANIEDTLQLAGAVAGKDYTYLDLLRLAEPYACQRHRDAVAQGKAGLGLHWPADVVHGDTP